jgi:hypothetical protein
MSGMYNGIEIADVPVEIEAHINMHETKPFLFVPGPTFTFGDHRVRWKTP